MGLYAVCDEKLDNQDCALRLVLDNSDRALHPHHAKLLVVKGTSGLPYYCAPLVCVPAVLEIIIDLPIGFPINNIISPCIPAVIGLLAVWRHNKPKAINLSGSAGVKSSSETDEGWHVRKAHGEGGSSHPRLFKGGQGKDVRRRFSIVGARS